MRAVFFGLSALDRNTNLMTSLLLIGLLTATHGMVYPFKSKITNIQEMAVLLNLHATFVIALYSPSNHYITEFLILLVLGQLIIIIIKHVKKNWFKETQVFAECATFKIFQVKYLDCFRLIQPKGENESQHNIMIPDVTYNYLEFQEPLIGQDN